MIILKIGHNNKSFSHLVFAESMTTEQVISIGEQLTNTVCIDYFTGYDNRLQCICQDNKGIVDISYEHIDSFSFLFPSDTAKVLKLKEELGMESLDEVLHYIISLH